MIKKLKKYDNEYKALYLKSMKLKQNYSYKDDIKL